MNVYLPAIATVSVVSCSASESGFLYLQDNHCKEPKPSLNTMQQSQEPTYALQMYLDQTTDFIGVALRNAES